MQYRQFFTGLAAVSVLMTTTLAISAETAQFNIAPKAGKTICQSGSSQIGDAAAKVELCVAQGNFSHDTYLVKIDGKQVLKGIDDETTKGVSVAYQSRKLNLVCTPQNEGPTDVAPERVAAMQKNMPKLSEAEAKAMVIMMETVEVGRLCKATLDDQALFAAQVTFE
ncbi:hypothetical protein PQR63_19340 [Herbaspirillum rhizosphaerae]|uniref:Uncharacterized protein n=1 Tax=Herbaspirillum rhizosphaerae TaxID=346179 RepID=A0ABW8ZF60_9BURK